MKQLFLLCILMFWFAYQCSASDRKKLIIDTDCGADDLRAISLLLASDQYDILAITTSDGVLAPETGLQKVRSLLCTHHHQGIATAAGRTTVTNPCECRNFNLGIQWGKECTDFLEHRINASQLIINVLTENRNIHFLAFGTLTNLNDALKLYTAGEEKISRILWYNQSISYKHGFNYENDSISVKEITEKKLPLTAVSSNPASQIIFDERMLENYHKCSSIYAENIYTAFISEQIINVIHSGHLQVWDELIPLYLMYPHLFETIESRGLMDLVCVKQNVTGEAIGQFVTEMFVKKPVENVTFNSFPSKPGDFRDDVAQVADSIIGLHGNAEFRAMVLANELHGHLGIYSMLGVKMGIRALNYFNCDIDALTIQSFAGNEPPVSCLNDGLQVSTGSTLGHGLINVYHTEFGRAVATFCYLNSCATISINKDTQNLITKDFQRIIQEYGLMTEDYWQEIRRLGIHYWLVLDRNDIFEIQPFIK